ncbi:MAG: hypothetical protein ACEPOV_04590 [Hyphomicrobiales bacterium]
MSKKVKELEFNEVLSILNEYDTDSVYERVNIIPDSSDLYGAIEDYVDIQNINKRSVLGIDIYRYGLYKHLEQTLIPALFKILMEKAIKLSLDNNQFVFQKYDRERVLKSFISTGDGGFMIFETPLHALFFAINFEMVIRAYNSYHLYPKLRNIIGSISLRYAITYDTIFHFDDNYYGSSIINNSRILERDSLNRCLIDQNSYDWFLINIDGIENLQVYCVRDLANIYDFQDYDLKFIDEGVNLILDKDDTHNRKSGIINSDISKIGQIRSKERLLDIFNLHLQATMIISSDHRKDDKRIITISLGNLNTAGIEH